MTTGCGRRDWKRSAAAGCPDGEMPGHGEQLPSCLLVRRMQGDGEVHIQPGMVEGLDAGHDADGRHGDLPPAEPTQGVVADATDRTHHLREIEQGFAHAHEDHGLQTSSQRQCLASERQELVEDLDDG